jgi:guanylate kinase
MGSLFIVSASSGAGKTSVVTEVIKRLNPPYSLERVITCTSKKPRKCEVDGRDYHFFSPQEFEKQAAAGFFLETSCAYGTYYGTPKTVLEGLEKGISYILIIDRAGAAAISCQIPSAILIWMYVDSLSVLEGRLWGRGTEDNDQIQERLFLAQQEMKEENERPFYQHHIINDNFEVAISSLMSIVIPILKKQ